MLTVLLIGFTGFKLIKTFEITAGTKITVYTTAESTNLRMTATDTLKFSDFGQPKETQPCVFVDPTKTFQTFMGVGGALTDASAETFYKLSKPAQQEIIERLYDPQKGIGYTFGRTNIHSCDFSSDTYTYVNDGDADLKSFNIAHDRKFKIPFIKQAQAAAGGKLTLFATPWSPPAWMKSNKDILHGGTLLPAFYKSWANYYIKFLDAYKKEGINFFAISVQNEPMATQSWESCVFSADQERDFIKVLGPTMHNGGYADKKIIAWDHNRDLMYQRASTILDDPESAKYVWGIGFHWYESWTGGGNIYDNVRRTAEAYPKTNLIFTEGCAESFKLDLINDWHWGEMYGRSMINDFNNGTVAWTDWNVLLDETGGPNHVGNFCFAPVHADTKTSKISYLNSFYYIGHFSKFIRPGAKRIISAASRGQLLTTAFLNTDGKIAVVVMNHSQDKIPYRLWIAGKAAETVALPHSIQTLVVE